MNNFIKTYLFPTSSEPQPRPFLSKLFSSLTTAPPSTKTAILSHLFKSDSAYPVGLNDNTYDPVSPLLVSLQEAASQGSKRASTFIRAFFKSLGDSPDEHKVFFKDYFTSENVYENEKEETATPLESFSIYLRSAMKNSKDTIVSLIDSISKDMKQAGEEVNGNAFSDYAGNSGADELEAVGTFVEYLYGAVRAGSEPAAKLMKQWVTWDNSNDVTGNEVMEDLEADEENITEGEEGDTSVDSEIGDASEYEDDDEFEDAESESNSVPTKEQQALNKLLDTFFIHQDL
jgi:hypothetical protein